MPTSSKPTLNRLKTIALYTVGAAGLFMLAMFLMHDKAKAADKGGAPVNQLFNDGAPSPKQSWTGFYLSIEGGYADALIDPIFGVDGHMYGARAGGNVQMGVMVGGAYVGFDKMSMSVGGSNVNADSLYYGALLGLLPTASKDVLIYGTGGQRNFNIDGLGKLNQNWFAGGGAQWRMTENWSAGLEYTRTFLEDAPGNARVNTTMISLTYKLPPLSGLK